LDVSSNFISIYNPNDLIFKSKLKFWTKYFKLMEYPFYILKLKDITNFNVIKKPNNELK